MIVALDGGVVRFEPSKRIIAVDPLPRSAMGEVRKAKLRKPYAT
ncbi:hypothetical protein ACM61V_04590 [Sphingomonas sp. TX0543]